MRPYVLDTNLYIEATRDPAAADALAAFYSNFVSRIHLHSVVAQELLAGAVSPELQRRTQASFIEPFETVGRLITPTHAAWKRAGEIVATLIREKRMSAAGIGRGFVNDCLLAASARQHGFILVTRNFRDFDLISMIEPIEVEAPWPGGQ